MFFLFIELARVGLMKTSQFISEILIQLCFKIHVQEKSRLYADVALHDPPLGAVTHFRETAFLLPAHVNMAPPTPLLAGG